MVKDVAPAKNLIKSLLLFVNLKKAALYTTSQLHKTLISNPKHYDIYKILLYCYLQKAEREALRLIMYKLLSPSEKSHTYFSPALQNYGCPLKPNSSIRLISSQGPNHMIRTNKACRQSQGLVCCMGALRRGRHELDGRRQGRGGGRRARLRAAIREREAPTVQTSGQKHLSSTLTLSTGHRITRGQASTLTRGVIERQ